MTVRETRSTSCVVRILNIWPKNFGIPVSVPFRDWFSRVSARMHAQGSQQSNRVALLRHRQPTHRPLETLDMRGKHVVDQGAALRRQLAEHHSRILGTCPPPHQPSLLEFLDDI